MDTLQHSPRLLKGLATQQLLGRLNFCLATCDDESIPEWDQLLASVAKTIQQLPPYAPSTAAVGNLGWQDSACLLSSARLQFILSAVLLGNGHVNYVAEYVKAALRARAAPDAPPVRQNLQRTAASRGGQTGVALPGASREALVQLCACA